MSVEVRGIAKRFGRFTALDDVSLHVPTGGLVAVLGPSGSGKTTLLRIIGGLETPDAGQILLHGEDATATRVQDRRVGFVFQHYALFRHLTVFENVAFGLRVRPRRERPSNERIRARVEELLALVQLDGLAGRFPSQLSGGQRQRVALARALAIDPRVLLLDEPFGALDAQVRRELRTWLRRLHDELHVTGILVTHDREEALEVADRVVVMNRGRIEQVGTPDEVYERPTNPFVFRFLGQANVVPEVAGAGEDHADTSATPGTVVSATGRTTRLVRPHDIAVSRTAVPGAFGAAIAQVHSAGPVVRLTLLADEGTDPLTADLSRERQRQLQLAVGDRVFVTPRQVHIFADEGTPAGLGR